jgi:hypothetical protein
MADTTTVEGYKQYCDGFHEKRLSTASLAENKMRTVLGAISGTDKPYSVCLTEYELVLAIEALNYYLRHTK